MPLLSTDEDQEIQYRYVRIQSGGLDAKLISTSATLGSLYQVSMTLDASNTVVDDGSWDEHYQPTTVTDDETGDLVVTLDSQIISDADDLGDATDNLTIIEE